MGLLAACHAGGGTVAESFEVMTGSTAPCVIPALVGRSGVMLAAWLCLSASVVHADGAFADSKVILLPRDQPRRIVLSSDVQGLLVSDDAGASFSWICENAIGRFAALFQLGPAPTQRMFAITQSGLSMSTDAGCSWQRPEGITRRAGDAFPDPTDPAHVVSIVQTTIAPDSPQYGDAIVESHDGGASFGEPLYKTADASISGVEQAQSDPARLYFVMSSLELQHPYIGRSEDGGASWRLIDVTAQLPRRPLVLRIVAVDPENAQTLYLRMSDGQRDALVISRDGGETVRVVHQLDGDMSAFLRRTDGTLLLAGSAGQAFRSDDGATSFVPWIGATGALHIQALGERDGSLYAVTSSQLDGFAAAVSQDDGAHWRPLLRLSHLRGPMQCGELPVKCEREWTALQPSLEKLSGPALDPDPFARAEDSSAALSCATTLPGPRRGHETAPGWSGLLFAMLLTAQRVLGRWMWRS